MAVFTGLKNRMSSNLMVNHIFHVFFLYIKLPLFMGNLSVYHVFRYEIAFFLRETPFSDTSIWENGMKVAIHIIWIWYIYDTYHIWHIYDTYLTHLIHIHSWYIYDTYMTHDWYNCIHDTYTIWQVHATYIIWYIYGTKMYVYNTSMIHIWHIYHT